MKFRRQHPIGPYFADFACISARLVVEIDGSSHDLTGERDLQRDAALRKQGWQVIRFSDKDVEDDAEQVARAIAQQLGLEYRFERRKGTGSGMKRSQPHRGRPSPG